jgi:hypothetical protein
MRSATHLLAIPFLLLAIAAAPEEKASRSFAVADHGEIQLSYPKAWKVSVRQGPASLKLPPTIMLESAEGQKFMVQITPIPSRDGKAESMEGLRRMAEGRGQHDLQSSRETKIDYQELKSESARGYYYSLTDKNPDSGEFKYMTAAIVGVGDLVLNVTILDNDPKRPQRQQAIEMLKAAKQIGAATQPAAAALVTNPPAKQLRVAAPGGKFELLMDQRDLQMLGEQGQGNSKAIMAANEDGWAVSIFLEPAAKPGDARVVRAFYEERLKRSPLKREELKLAGDAKKATTEYVIKDLEQKNINVYMVQEGTWVDVHISKTEFAPEERKMLDELVASIHVERAPGKK